MRLHVPWARPGLAPLAGERVKLVIPTIDHFEAWAALRLESRRFLEPWEPEWHDSDLTKSAFKTRLRRYAELRKQDLAEAYFLLAGKTLVGSITLTNIRRGVAQTATIGYWIGQPYARQGLMTEALGLLEDRAFGDLALHRIEAACLPRNHASVALLEKCGFEREGLARSYLKIAGQWEDHVLFAKIKRI
jgi:[ribosomal protein S5]-alanine N-acetyltransferase